MELKGRSLARVTAGLLVAAQPEVQPASITTDSRWTIEAWRLSTLRHEWSLQSSGHPGLGEVVGGYFYYGDGVGMHRVAVPPGKPEERQTRLFPDGIRAWPLVKGGRVYFNGDGHSIYGLDASDLERGWRHYCDCLPEFADGDGAYGTGSVGFGLAPIRKDGEAFWKVGPGGGAGGTTTRQF
ncbi:MAG TPA: hypothetical protein VK689_08885, partial [Armatimonadota bacterium]|nr:hypothetical protein [Armatimonadota bacterium]